MSKEFTRRTVTLNSHPDNRNPHARKPLPNDKLLSHTTCFKSRFAEFPQKSVS